MRTFRVLPAVACLPPVVAAALAVVPAQATFKGKNGLIAYQQQVGDHVQLFTARPDGSDTRQVTNWPDSDSINANWSPDGAKLNAFIRIWKKNGQKRKRIYTMNADGSDPRELDRKPALRVGLAPRREAPPWCEALRYTIVDADGPSSARCGHPGPWAAACALPDRKRVALLVDKRTATTTRAAIFIGRLGGGRGSLKRITPWAGIADKIDCSPDGSRIVYSKPDVRPAAVIEPLHHPASTAQAFAS